MFKMLAIFAVCGRWINEYTLTLILAGPSEKLKISFL